MFASLNFNPAEFYAITPGARDSVGQWLSVLSGTPNLPANLLRTGQINSIAGGDNERRFFLPSKRIRIGVERRALSAYHYRN